MSGGHFDHQEYRFIDIAEQLERDIEYNDVSWENPVVTEYRRIYGFQLEPATLDYLRKVAAQLRYLQMVLHEYDLAVSKDTCEKTFQQRVGIAAETKSGSGRD